MTDIHETIGRTGAGLFTEAQLSALRAQYATLSGIDPDCDAYRELITKLDGMTQPMLKQLAAADIRFLSRLASNRVNTARREADRFERTFGDRP